MNSRPEHFDDNLTSALLEEIPRQMIECYKSRDMKLPAVN